MVAILKLVDIYKTCCITTKVFVNHYTNDNVVHRRIARQESKGIRLMYIPNDDTQNYSFFRLQLLVETFENST